jgi:tight adherence protein B
MSLLELMMTNKKLVFALVFGGALIVCAVGMFLIAYDASRKERLRIRTNVSELIRWQFGNSKAVSNRISFLQNVVDGIVSGTPTSATLPTAVIAIACVILAARIATGSFLIALIIAGVFTLAVYAYVCIKKSARKRQIEDQFCRACRQIATSLRSGMTLEGALRLYASHAKDPLASELDHAIVELSINPSISSALKHVAERTKNNDIALFANVVSLHERKGGQLASSLETLSATISTRLSMRRRVRSESSSAKMACIAIVVISIAIFGIGWFMIPSFVEFYTTQTLGWIIAAVCILMFVMGAVILFKMANIDVS